MAATLPFSCAVYITSPFAQIQRKTLHFVCKQKAFLNEREQRVCFMDESSSCVNIHTEKLCDPALPVLPQFTAC